MFVDENKIRRRSGAMSGGFKGVVPRPRAGGKTTAFDRARMIIGWSMTLALAAATAILLFNLFSAGRDLADRKTKLVRARANVSIRSDFRILEKYVKTL